MGFSRRRTEPCSEGQEVGQAIAVQRQEGDLGEMKRRRRKESRTIGREVRGGPSKRVPGRQRDRVWVRQLKKRLMHGRGKERGWRGLRKDKHGEITAAAMGGVPQREQSKPRGTGPLGKQRQGVS